MISVYVQLRMLDGSNIKLKMIYLFKINENFIKMSDSRPMNVNTFLQNSSVEEIKEYYKSISTKDIVCCLNLSGDINVGVMMRTSALFGVENFVILGRRTYDRRTSVGIQNYIPHERHQMTQGHNSEELDEEKIRDFILNAMDKYHIVAVEQNERSFSLPKIHEHVSSDKPVMFLFGNEASGIPKSILDIPEVFVVEIPQRGVGRSFNVSSACAIVLYEWYR